jgi:hypothetical protein
MAAQVKIAGVWNSVSQAYVRASGVWSTASAWVKAGGVWLEMTPTINLTIAADTTAYNIAAEAAAAGWDEVSIINVIVTVNSGIVVSGNDDGDSAYAMRTGIFPAGCVLRLINNGYIIGRGGKGGNGGSQGSPTGTAGAKGGTALYAESPLIVENNGIIAGGGGGGGGGDRDMETVGAFGNTHTEYYGGGGGGSGQSSRVNVSGGSGGVANDATGNTGGTGTFANNGGGGGSVGDGTGGAGGDWGLAGAGGRQASGNSKNNQGAAGRYIKGSGLVTWAVQGDTRGGVGA